MLRAPVESTHTFKNKKKEKVAYHKHFSITSFVRFKVTTLYLIHNFSICIYNFVHYKRTARKHLQLFVQVIRLGDAPLIFSRRLRHTDDTTTILRSPLLTMVYAVVLHHRLNSFV